MIGFPLLLIPLAIYNIIAFLMRDVSFAAPLVSVPLPSGASWTVTLSDALLAFGLFLLLLEIIKGARPAGKYLTDHLLAFLIFAGAAAEFAMLPPFGTSTFLLLTLLALIDFLSGISLRARRVRRAVVPAAVAVEESPLPEPRLAPAEPAESAPRGSPAPVRPLAPDILEPAAQHPAGHGSDIRAVRAEPIIDGPSDVAEAERERRADEVIVPARTPPLP